MFHFYLLISAVNHHHAHVIPFPTSNAPHIADHKLPEVISEPATVFGVHASHGLHLRAGPFCGMFIVVAIVRFDFYLISYCTVYMYAGFRVQLDHVNCVVDDLMKEHGGFRNYIKSEAEKRHLVGAVWRGNRKSVRIEVEGTHKNVSSFRHFLYELVTNEWVNHITTEESWEELRNVRLISTTFNIRKNSSKYTESGAFSDDGYEADVHSSADFIQA